MFSFLQFLVVAAISYAAFGAAIWGLVDASRRSNEAFVSASKQTKTLWVVILVVATALLFISLPFPLGGGSGPFGIVGLAAAVAVIVYHVGVKPALGPHRKGPSGGGRNTRNTGGW
ncbi:DUF2516 family protein [Demequina sp.]|uniref:DUF2516 family protein n=1 Tax=Demequina sp. TaxID=2050685 RepID=UPI0025C26B1A|nr:DUF2516 family protein [Demequina sp.]